MVIQKSPKFFHLQYLFIFLLTLSLFKSTYLLEEEECPRNKPILKANECQSIYCTPEEYSKNICTISNSFIKEQWLNNMHIFEEKYMSHISVSQSPKGDLFLSSHKGVDDFDKYIFGFNSEGEGLFYDEKTDKNTSFEIIDFAIREFADYNIYTEIDNKGYLLSVPTDDDIYLIDYVNKTSKWYTVFPVSKSSDTIFKINGYDDMFFTAYIYCKDTNNCFLHFQSFKLNLTKMERIKNITNVPTVMGTRINCFQNEKGYIFCIYTRKEDNNDMKHMMSVINPVTFKFDHQIVVEKEFITNPFFDETIQLREDLYILAYAIDEEVIKMQFKNITISEFDSGLMLSSRDFFKDIPDIKINEDKKLVFKNGSFKKNDLYKINDNKFALLVKDFSKDGSSSVNSILQIYIFTIYNNDQNINFRRYSIDFELYNKHGYDDIRGYNLGDFFGVIMGLTLDRTTYQSIATFMTFGYVNTTEQEKYDTKLKYNNTNSKIILKEYINEIENNVFGYEFIGVKILSLPSEENAGYFTNNITNKKVEINDTYDINSELQFILSDKYKTDIYSIIFVGVIFEPSYERMNNFSEELKEYPLNQNNSEEEFYEPKILYGKRMNYKFRLSDCYDSCETCKELSEDENNQKCIKCRNGFYFKEGTNNCYDKIDTKYYFDEDTHMFSKCYDDCLTCSTKEISPRQMNCLTCDYNLKYYNKSKNCLNCSKYVNYEQNECLETIPDGYYLEDKDLGTLGKCYYLCKTCIAGPYIKSNYLHMNCKTCLFNNKKFTPIFDGDCPDTPEEEGEDTPVDGQCSYNKPILKNGKCQLIYCTPEEFESKICLINNDTLKEQWLNNFHIFSEESTSSVCLSEDIISNEKVIFLAQGLENGYTDKYLYGFYKNGSGIFYDENKKLFNNYKTILFPVQEDLIKNLAYIEIDSDGYLLTTPVKNNLYLINYKDGDKSDIKLELPAYSTDRIILRQKKTSAKNAEYITDYIYCENNDLEQCYLQMINFEASNNDLKETNSLTSKVKVYKNSNLNCYKDDKNYIKCIYNKKNEDSQISHVIGIFSAFENKNIELVKELELEYDFDEMPSFDSMIEWSNDVYFIVYSLSYNRNSIKILFKKIYNDIYTNVIRIEDYFDDIPYIYINEDSLYTLATGEAKNNSLCKISDEKFAMMVNIYRGKEENIGLVIFIFTIYDSQSKINIRHYPIQFKLYNTLIDGKIIGYNLNNFFGTLIELNAPGDNDKKRAAFFTFGYMNSTNDITPQEGYDILINKKEKIIIENYFTKIENNLFGYELTNYRIISVPDEINAGYFSLNNAYNKLNDNDNIGLKSQVGFYISGTPVKGNYSFIFAPMLKETNSYKKMNTYCQKLESYPLGQNDTESKFYEPKSFIGKHFDFKFYLEGSEACYKLCKTCYEPSNNKNNQKCNECIDNFYKMNGTNNCYNGSESIPGYYFDEDEKKFYPCYENCESCYKNLNDRNNQQCIKCKSYYYKVYETDNCFRNTEIIPGYYFDYENEMFLPCHELCKTCEKGQEIIDGEIHMNCKECKYRNDKYIIKIEGNCPDKQDEDEDEEEKEKEEEKEEEKDKDKEEEGKEDKEEEEERKDVTPKKDEEKEEGTSVFLWVLFISIIIIVIIVAVIFIRKYLIMSKYGKMKNDYTNLEKRGQNISMEDTTGLGIDS